MVDSLLIYGATGYTGRLLVGEARRSGFTPIVAGRNRARVAALAEGSGLEARSAPLGDSTTLEAMLDGVKVVLNAAGPFRETVRPLVQACIRRGVHYLDISGEVDALEAVARYHGEAAAQGVMLMPAVGFDVVASDCLAAYVAGLLPGMERLSIGIAGLRLLSRGSARTAAPQIFSGQVCVRRQGRLERVEAGRLSRAFDFGEGPRRSLAVSWGDVVTAHCTTGAPDITVYFEENPFNRLALEGARWWKPALANPWVRAWHDAAAALMPEGPTPEQREASRLTVVVEAELGSGARAVARLTTPEAYSFTALSAVRVARRVLMGDFEVGFQTPGRVYGADLVLGIPGVLRENLSGVTH